MCSLKLDLKSYCLCPLTKDNTEEKFLDQDHDFQVMIDKSLKVVLYCKSFSILVVMASD